MKLSSKKPATWTLLYVSFSDVPQRLGVEVAQVKLEVTNRDGSRS